MIQVRNLTKQYGGTQALSGLSLDLHPGEIHAVCGENGAGKSTLNRILAGLVVPDEGSIAIDGAPLTLGSVVAAERAGIVLVHQESAVFPHLTAVENHELMREPGSVLWVDLAAMRERTQKSLERLEVNVPLNRPMVELSGAQRQMVSIARALSQQVRLLILDEPTSMLGQHESETLFRAVRHLRDEGVCVLFVSHRLEEVFDLADRVTVLRDGRHVATMPIGGVDRAGVVRLMAGDVERDVTVEVNPVVGDVLLNVRDITRYGEFERVSFEVHAGEVVVLAGLVGAGRSEVARAIFGLDALDEGSVLAGGVLALVPEDRQHEGLHLEMSIRDNISMANQKPFIRDRTGESQRAEAMIQATAVKASSDLVPVASLSGGNQQKVLVGKWLTTDPTVMIVDEPTRGVDVLAKAQIHDLIRHLAREGKAVLVVSSDIEEVLALGDRILVMCDGHLVGELPRSQADQESVLRLALPQDSKPLRSNLTSAREKPQRRLLWTALLLIGLVGATGFANPSFLSLTNLMDILVKTSPVVIVGAMMTLVILAREIDISVGSLMGLSAAVLGVAGSTDRMGLPVPVAIGMCLGAGAAGGLVSGLLIAKARVPSIVVTLGMLTIFRGVTEITMGGKWIENLPPGLRELGTGAWLGMPHSVSVAVLVSFLALWIVRRTSLGLQIRAVGSNPHAATLHGIPVDRVRIALFMLTGLGAALAALFSATQLQVVESGFGSGFELVVIAAVVVGGTSIRGGTGTVLGTVLGSLLLGTISTALIFLKLGDSATYWERAIQGGLILLAVVGDHFLSRRRT